MPWEFHPAFLDNRIKAPVNFYFGLRMVAVRSVRTDNVNQINSLFGESFGIVLLEAMATGTVCVAGNNSGYSDVMRDLGAISLVNSEDTEEFARRLDILLHEPELRALWLKWAAGYVKQFDNKLITDRYEELYKEVLKQHGRSKA